MGETNVGLVDFWRLQNKLSQFVIEKMSVVYNYRRKAAQVRGLRESLQPVVQLDHTLPEAHRLQAFRLRPLRTRLPAQS